MPGRKRKGAISRIGAKPKRRGFTVGNHLPGYLTEPDARAESLARIQSVAGLILAVTENRNWIEVFFEGDMMHTKTINLPGGRLFDIYIEDIPHKTTVYEHPRTMVLFAEPCDVCITRDGDKVVVTGQRS
jgi:hypothetical protein